MRSYSKVRQIQLEGGGFAFVHDRTSGDIALSAQSGRSLCGVSQYFAQFARFAQIVGYTQDDLDRFNQCVHDNGDPDCLLTGSQYWSGLGFWSEIAGNSGLFSYVPYSDHPKN